jgi:hypothetical protein
MTRTKENEHQHDGKVACRTEIVVATGHRATINEAVLCKW